MQRPSDEILIAYLDGELDEHQTLEVIKALADDDRLQAHAERLNASARSADRLPDETSAERNFM